MNRDKMVRKESDAVQKVDARPDPETVYLPAVDIFEGRDALRLRADMPGVEPSAVNVSVENDVLTIEGKAACEEPSGYALAGQEFCVGRYRRDFSLSGEVDTGGIKAKMKNGVLEVLLPKSVAAKTRKIEIET
jgi:HSP20 family molecular chaperone IbpA